MRCNTLCYCTLRALEMNAVNNVSAVNGEVCLSTLNSKIAAYIIPVNEELVIAQEMGSFADRA